MSQITLNEYVFDPKDKIGRGSSGVVYLGYHYKTRDKVAIKRVDISNLNQKMTKLWNEIQIMKGLSHPNVIKLYDVHLDIKNEYLYLIMEYCDGSDLSEFITDYILDLKQIHEYMGQIKDGLQYLHEKGIVHRDLKPHNMLLHGDKIKIADFGLSVMNNQYSHLMQTMCGSPLYMSPEIIEHQKYTAKSDLWSIGIIMYQMIYRAHPYQDCRNFAELTLKVKTEKIKYPEKPPLDSLTQDLLNNLLTKNCHERITWADFFNHTWFKHLPPQNTKKFHSLEMSYQDMFNTENSLSDYDESDSDSEESDPIVEVSPTLKTELTQSSYLYLSQKSITNPKMIQTTPAQEINYQKRNQSTNPYGYYSEQPPKLHRSEGFNLKEYVVNNYQKPPSRIPETMSRIKSVRHHRPVYGTSAPSNTTNLDFSPSKLDFNSVGSGILKYVGKSFHWVKSSIDT